LVVQETFVTGFHRLSNTADDVWFSIHTHASCLPAASLACFSAPACHFVHSQQVIIPARVVAANLNAQHLETNAVVALLE
jgi:hypothetical protein